MKRGTSVRVKDDGKMYTTFLNVIKQFDSIHEAIENGAWDWYQGYLKDITSSNVAKNVGNGTELHVACDWELNNPSNGDTMLMCYDETGASVLIGIGGVECNPTFYATGRFMYRDKYFELTKAYDLDKQPTSRICVWCSDSGFSYSLIPYWNTYVNLHFDKGDKVPDDILEAIDAWLRWLDN